MRGKPDRRVERTRQLLREALFALIRQKGFEGVTVQEIIDRANVGRATFYAHFENKEDLLVSGFEDLQASLKKRQREAASRGKGVDERVFAFSEEMFTHAGEYRELFFAMAGKRSGAMVETLLRKLLLDLVREDVKALVGERRERVMHADAVTQFIAGGMFGMLAWWLKSGARIAVSELNAEFRRLAIAAVKASG